MTIRFKTSNGRNQSFVHTPVKQFLGINHALVSQPGYGGHTGLLTKEALKLPLADLQVFSELTCFEFTKPCDSSKLNEVILIQLADDLAVSLGHFANHMLENVKKRSESTHTENIILDFISTKLRHFFLIKCE